MKYKKDITGCEDIPRFLLSLEVSLSKRGKAYHTFIDEVENLVSESYKKIGD